MVRDHQNKFVTIQQNYFNLVRLLRSQLRHWFTGRCNTIMNYINYLELFTQACTTLILVYRNSYNLIQVALFLSCVYTKT